MMTLTLIALVLLAVLLVAGMIHQFASLARGCPLATLWLILGGAEATGKLLVLVLGAIVEVLGSLSE